LHEEYVLLNEMGTASRWANPLTCRKHHFPKEFICEAFWPFQRF